MGHELRAHSSPSRDQKIPENKPDYGRMFTASACITSTEISLVRRSHRAKLNLNEGRRYIPFRNRKGKNEHFLNNNSNYQIP